MSTKSRQENQKNEACVDCPRGTICTFFANGLPAGCAYAVFGTCFKCGKEGSYAIRKLPKSDKQYSLLGHFLMPEHVGCEVSGKYKLLCLKCLQNAITPIMKGR